MDVIYSLWLIASTTEQLSANNDKIHLEDRKTICRFSWIYELIQW